MLKTLLKYIGVGIKEKKTGYKFSPTTANIEMLNFWPHENTADLWLHKFAADRFKDQLTPDNVLSFSSVFGEKSHIGKSPAGTKVFFSGENLIRFPQYEDCCFGTVDLSMGFDYTDHPDYVRFPLWILYLFKPDCNYTAIKKQLAHITTSIRTGYKPDKQFCSLVCSHDVNGIRTLLMETLSNIEQVDSGGIYLNNTNALKEKYNDHKLSFLNSYKFNICPENTNKEGYVTEKVFEAIWGGCIPVYWGSNNNPEPEVLNKDAILFYEEEGDIAALVKQVADLHANEKRYREFMMQDRFKPHAAEYIADMVSEAENRIRKCLQ
ncbi:glycosyltransferase family 10 domain-containing protein [Chitinophaga sp. MM2321]|uniref:glycosyltransferase family 10 domain-containing protein n=1 Tax=Chitinophaga sp. MM2321 TaxID=3137178 RepID=UPI0032D59398